VSYIRHSRLISRAEPATVGRPDPSMAQTTPQAATLPTPPQTDERPTTNGVTRLGSPISLKTSHTNDSIRNYSRRVLGEPPASIICADSQNYLAEC